MGAQLWSAERAVHASALSLLTSDDAPRDVRNGVRKDVRNGVRDDVRSDVRKDVHRDIATNILARIVDQYHRWPNRDNVLGPSRPFFSTYLESIWLLNICHAIALLETADVDGSTQQLLGRVREQVVRIRRAFSAQRAQEGQREPFQAIHAGPRARYGGRPVLLPDAVARPAMSRG